LFEDAVFQIERVAFLRYSLRPALWRRLLSSAMIFSALNLPSSLSFYVYVCWPLCALLPCANALFFDAQP
jgi:hypothetical protein